MASEIVDSIQLGDGGTCRIIHTPAKSSRGSLLILLKGGGFVVCMGGFTSCTTVLFNTQPDAGKLVLLCYAVFASLYLFTVCVLLKNEFVLKQRHLSLPFVYWFATGGRLRWSWSQLQRVVFARSSAKDEMPNQLILYFDKGNGGAESAVCINHKDISEVDLKKFVYAIVNNAPLASFEPALSEVEPCISNRLWYQALELPKLHEPMG